MFPCLNNVNQIIVDLFCKFFFDLYKECNSCLISLLSFSELFPAFNSAKETGNLISFSFGVKNFNPCPDLILLLSEESFQQYP